MIPGLELRTLESLRSRVQRPNPRTVVLKVGSAPPGGPRVKCLGSPIIQLNIGVPCTFKEKKIENNRILFGDIEKGPIVEIA